MRQVLMKLEFPFCFRPCGFCDRKVIGGWDSARMDAYCDAMRKEIEASASDFSDCEVVAIRYGGGIASNAGQQIAEVARSIQQGYRLADDVWITMRSSISNFSGANMPYFKRAGIQRFDMEMMELFQPAFVKINRTDAFEDFPIVCDSFLHSYGNDSLGLMLVYGHNDLTTLDFRRSVLAAVNTTHASHIELRCAVGEKRASDEVIAEHLEQARSILPDKGFREYQPFNFARTGCEDRFLASWNGGMDTLSFGLGARMRFDGVMSTNTSDLSLYLAHSDDCTLITEDVRKI